MSTLEIRNEILEIVQNEDDSSLKNLYKIIKHYKYQKELDRMIAEGEEDIKKGNLYSTSEVETLLKSWINND